MTPKIYAIGMEFVKSDFNSSAQHSDRPDPDLASVWTVVSFLSVVRAGAAPRAHCPDCLRVSSSPRAMHRCIQGKTDNVCRIAVSHTRTPTMFTPTPSSSAPTTRPPTAASTSSPQPNAAATKSASGETGALKPSPANSLPGFRVLFGQIPSLRYVAGQGPRAFLRGEDCNWTVEGKSTPAKESEGQAEENQRE